MMRKNNTIYGRVKSSIILSIIFCSILFSAIGASAVDIGYYWDRTNGTSIAAYTTNWTTCSSTTPQSGFRVTSIGSAASSCTNGALTRTNVGDMFLEIFPTAYTSNTLVKGVNATFYLGRPTSGTTTYRIFLGYVNSGVFTSFGNVTQSLTSSSNRLVTINTNTISGTAPAGSNLSLKLSVTTLGRGQTAQVNPGTNGGSTGSNSGRFYVNETVTSQTSTYNVTVTPSPASANVAAGGSSVYTIRVNNTGNTNGNYNLVVSDSNSANFQTSTLGTSSLTVTAGGSNQTTLTVTAKAGATTGASDITTVTATSVQNSSYTGSAQVTTNVVGIIPAHTFDTSATDGTTTFANTPNPRTLLYTSGTGSTVMVLNIFTTPNTARAGGAPTFNGKIFTQVGTRQQTAGSTPEGAVEMWYLLLTPSDTGSAHTVSVPNTGSRLMRIHVSTYKSTTGASALDVFAQRPNTGTTEANPSQSITTTADGDVLVDALFDGRSSVSSVNSHTLLYKQLAASSYSANSQYYLQPTAGAQALSWTAAADDFALITASFKAVQTSSSSYNVTVTPSPASANVAAGGSSVYTIRVNNTGNTNGNYNLAVSDSNSANFQTSTLGTSSLAVTAGGSNQITLTVTAKAGATTGTIDNTTVTVISVENSAYTSSTNVRTAVTGTTPSSNSPRIIVKASRYVVLDDPNAGTTAPGFFSPADVRGGNWGTNYWSGESTTIRAAAIVMSSGGSKLPGVSVTFKLTNPAGGSPVHTATSITDGEGAAYYSYDLNAKNYWGNWKIDASATVESNNIADNSSFVLYWWGCGQCHGSESPGNWGNMYTPKSYYTMGYDFHRSQDKTWHTEPMKKGACIVCHQMYNGTPVNYRFTDNSNTFNQDNEYSPDWHNGKVKCQDCHAGSNISNTPQGKNPEIAGCYDMPGCHPEKNTNVNRENSTSGYIVGGTYRSLYSNIPNSAKAHTVTSVRCILCHDAGHIISKPYNVSGTSNTNTENEQCWACHTQRPAHYGTGCTGCHSQNAHNISISGGGPDCISCHGVGGTASRKVDENAIAAGVHGNLNSGAAASDVSAANKKCWGCHQSDGNQPTDMGNKYSTPYRCYECHGPTKPYTRISGAMTINEHFKSAMAVKAGIFAVDDSTSCVLCHSVSEMTVSFTDNDFSQLSLGSHYGKNRTGTLDCRYCHQNISTAFSAAIMSNIENNNLANHSRSSLTPVCTTCHGSGMLHDATLSMPASSAGTYCKTCHSNKNEHKAVNCAECHTNNTDRSEAGREIHGIRYLQKDNTFSTGKTNVVDCTVCHQSDAVNSSLLLVPPQISNQLHHSDDLLNGSKWGSYWTSQTEACVYCHNDTRHSLTPLGRPLIWNPSYVLNTVIGSGTNCADCHYKGDGNYGQMGSEFTGAGLSLSPEITSGSWNGKPGYYNHTLADYTDAQCKSCHDKSGSTTVGQLTHSNSIGSAGGPDCMACHDAGGTAPKLINFSAANNSAHKNLNSAASSTVNAQNKKCWACHGDGTQPASGHPATYKTPSSCETCHTGAGGYNAPLVKEHVQNGTDVQTAVNCTLCHDNNGIYIEGAISGTVTHYLKDVTDTATTPYGHFGPIDTTNCLICHRGTYTGDPVWGSPINITTSPKRVHTETSNAQCDICHKDGTTQTLANGDFHNSSLTGGTAQGPNCLACHAGAE